MSGTGIVVVRPGLFGLITYLDRNRVQVRSCGTCRSTREARKLERNVGFCDDCLERSRIAADDDIGGES